MAKPHLTLYGRVECHLCTDMAAALDDLSASLDFDYDMVEIDNDRDLMSRYGRLVPVLARDGRTICTYFLDLPALKAALGV